MRLQAGFSLSRWGYQRCEGMCLCIICTRTFPAKAFLLQTGGPLVIPSPMMVLIPRSIRKSVLRRTFLVLIVFLALRDVFHYYRLHAEVYHKRSLVPKENFQSDEKIFIVSTHWNNERILRDHWNAQVLRLAEHLGPRNVFVSVYESGSWDDSKGALRELSLALDAINVPNHIVLDSITHKDVINNPSNTAGWISIPGDEEKKELRRIPYLSNIRNLSLRPLLELQGKGSLFTKILFLNDVIFTVEDVLTLLDTNDRRYAAACSLDFSKPPKIYDTFAIRDYLGHEILMQEWPYFRSKRSREALKSLQDIPVSSCWNGMVFMDAEPFYNNTHPLRFRGIPDSLAQFHLEASECCLIHQDNPLGTGVWINPQVRVGYNKAAYDAMSTSDVPNTLSAYLKSISTNRFRRWLTTDRTKKWTISSRLAAWQRQYQDRMESENGEICLINEMQVLRVNGWAHV